MASVIYNAAKMYLMNGSVDLDTDTIKVMLLNNTYTPDIDAHNFQDDLTAYEVSGTGYTADGQSLASKTVTQDNTDDEGVFDAADLTWSTATITARYAALYKERGGADSANELICVFDFGSDKSSSAGNFTLQWNSEGIINLN